MKDVGNIPFIIFIIGFTLYLLKIFWQSTNYQALFIPKKRFDALDNFFSKSFNYYTLLNGKQRKRFLTRVYDVSNKLKIIGRSGFEITTPIKLYVAAAQVQLTFGFNRYFLSKFRTVLIYPDSFRNKTTGNLHDGEVNPRGIIVLSWKKFVKGYKDPYDRINLGLHEMAHALMHTVIHSDEHEVGLDEYMKLIIKLSTKEVEKIKSGEIHMFRKYAGANIFEFFAVAIENFFEAPKELQKELPNLYQYLSQFLKQDPANNFFVLTGKEKYLRN